MWLGVSSPNEFKTPDETVTAKVNGLCRWFTNLENNQSKEPIILTEKYSAEKYLKYDNYDAINVNKVVDIPMDYMDVIGVPITFLDKWNPNADSSSDVATTNDFEILGMTCRNYSPEYVIKRYTKDEYNNAADLNGSACIMEKNKPKSVYGRLLIKRKL